MNQSLGYISGEEIRRIGYPTEVFDAMRWAFLAVSSGAATIPPRQYVPLHQSQGNGLVMPAYVRSSPDGQYPDVYAVKMFNDIPGNREAGRATFQGVTVLFDIATGLPLATFDAAALTALRTGVSTAIATDFLAQTSASSVVGLVGVGPQGLSTLRALGLLRTISSVRVLTRHVAAVSELGFPIVECSDVAEVAKGADMVVMATNSGSPLLTLDMISDGCHVSALGSYRPAMRELGADLVAASRVWVDNLACLETSGDMINSGVEAQLFGECLSLSEKPRGRTLYKSIGSAAQDALAAWVCYKLLLG
ncbi:MAG: ornithine cyclodeaminase family protein [Armatimonadota bacterium]